LETHRPVARRSSRNCWRTSPLTAGGSTPCWAWDRAAPANRKRDSPCSSVETAAIRPPRRPLFIQPERRVLLADVAVDAGVVVFHVGVGEVVGDGGADHEQDRVVDQVMLDVLEDLLAA